MMSRILICGGREYYDREQFDASMEIAKRWFAPDYCVIEGNATGADSLAREWAKQRGIPYITIPANWAVYGKQAGRIRNTWMLDFAKPDLVIAFPGGVGTADMVRQAEKRYLSMWRV